MLKPHLARLHQLVNAGDKMPLPLFVATIDAERWTELAAVHSVTEYPSLLYFAAGRRAAPATFPGTDMASLLHFVGVQAQLGSAGADGHGFGVEGRGEPSASASASASASTGGGAAQWPNGPMGAITCRSSANPNPNLNPNPNSNPNPNPNPNPNQRSADREAERSAAQWSEHQQP